MKKIFVMFLMVLLLISSVFAWVMPEGLSEKDIKDIDDPFSLSKFLGSLFGLYTPQSIVTPGTTVCPSCATSCSKSGYGKSLNSKPVVLADGRLRCDYDCNQPCGGTPPIPDSGISFPSGCVSYSSSTTQCSMQDCQFVSGGFKVTLKYYESKSWFNQFLTTDLSKCSTFCKSSFCSAPPQPPTPTSLCTSGGDYGEGIYSCSGDKIMERWRKDDIINVWCLETDCSAFGKKCIWESDTDVRCDIALPAERQCWKAVTLNGPTSICAIHTIHATSCDNGMGFYDSKELCDAKIPKVCDEIWFKECKNGVYTCTETSNCGTTKSKPSDCGAKCGSTNQCPLGSKEECKDEYPNCEVTNLMCTNGVCSCKQVYKDCKALSGNSMKLSDCNAIPLGNDKFGVCNGEFTAENGDKCCTTCNVAKVCSVDADCKVENCKEGSSICSNDVCKCEECKEGFEGSDTLMATLKLSVKYCVEKGGKTCEKGDCVGVPLTSQEYQRIVSGSDWDALLNSACKNDLGCGEKSGYEVTCELSATTKENNVKARNSECKEAYKILGGTSAFVLGAGALTCIGATFGACIIPAAIVLTGVNFGTYLWCSTWAENVDSGTCIATSTSGLGFMDKTILLFGHSFTYWEVALMAFGILVLLSLVGRRS